MEVKRSKLYSSLEVSSDGGQSTTSWTLKKEDGKARLGTLRARGNVEYATPALLIPTVGGLVPHLTMDIWEDGPAYENVLLAVPFDQISIFASPNNQGRDAHESLNQNPKQVGICIRMPVVSKGSESDLASQCALVHNVLRPTIWIAPSDPINAYAGSNRTSLAVERTASAASEHALACIVGKDLRSATACMEKYATTAAAGYFVDTSLKSTALEIASRLPVGQPRGVASSTCTPAQILDFIAAGYDLVETNYAQYLAKMGFASTFILEGLDSAGAGADKLDMRSMDFLTDARPISPHCACFACKHHTRAYIRHLLETREMLGETLLYAHNLFSLVQLVSAARREIASGTFASWHARWRAVNY